MLKSCWIWRVATATSLALACSATAETSGVILKGETFTAVEDVLWYTPEEFKEVLTDAIAAQRLKVENDELRASNDAYSFSLRDCREESAQRVRALTLCDEEMKAVRSLADGLDDLFKRTDEALKRERKRNGPWLVSGPFVGVGVALEDGSFEPSVVAGWGVTFNVRGRR